MLKQKMKKTQRVMRKRRIRAKIIGTATCPRLSVFRSLRFISVQAIDDTTGTTLAHAHLKEAGINVQDTVIGAAAVGKIIAERLTVLGITTAVFDRSGYKYHGKVKALAEAVRENGLQC